MLKKIVILLSLAGAIILLDQLTKIYVHTEFSVGESVEVMSGFFDLTYVRNMGAAFGFLRNANEVFRKAFFLSITPLAMILILGILYSTKEEDNLQICSLSLIFAGAVGNYLDRIRFGYVIDFLDFHFKHRWHYPAFNVADISIVTGVFVLIGLTFYEDYINKKEGKKA